MCIFPISSSCQGHTHPPTGACCGLAEQQELGVGFRECSFYPFKSDRVNIRLGQDHSAHGGISCGDGWDWQTKNSRQVQFELAQVLADQSDQAGVVRQGETFRKISPHHHRGKKFHTDDACTAQVVGDGLGHGLSLKQLLVGQ